jgi:DNA-binding response OmpR family regulator
MSSSRNVRFEPTNYLGEKPARFGKVMVDFARMQVVRGGDPVQLKPTEFRLLAFFLQNPNRIFTRKQLLNAIWGSGVPLATRTVDVHIGKLRQKLEHDPAQPMHVRTVHAVGYKFVP